MLCRGKSCSVEMNQALTGCDRFRRQKFVKVSDAKKKLAWTGLGKVKKGLFSGKCLQKFLHDWSPGGRRSVLHFDGLTLTRGAVVATPFAVAYSLTSSLVKK